MDRELPGVELAPGLHLVERHLPFAGVPDELDLGFAKDHGPTERERRPTGVRSGTRATTGARKCTTCTCTSSAVPGPG